MSSGRLIAVVGPSGVGKDSVMAGLARACPALRLVRRTITRAPGLGGEEYDAVTPEAFDVMARAGAFCVHWSAHGLRYGIPADVLDDVRAGTDCLANFSRGALADAVQVFPALSVLNITASADTLAHRLAGRGREPQAEIAARLAQAEKPLPAGLAAITIRNDGPLDDTVARALAALQPRRS
ncbi:phosphonate metabolism protein/1,5-bisphosphokinase (PRPP-forming) PhnN [Lutimaribacter sp. EGI FJ00015]|uniref:Phosphonate metabolism protein/1,5-bisphosphokinase (PRPP-forming) PhnN n=1 Tax=Lutimaribacter degradans TaxID=2945989 RepID=A0ACC5ZTD3_9RHOB|nr:phosphonate metabolism protein/1,5-bisphosphokinase (PRPP-forming) PhnN [Lutimaribacter sp. EGI FJ00013]MCM2561301.1 phosphonate metabolism protein/1,5-bisphosphokinase (PRPP-forming) PhnN [Lutimaribacter sp. EGI FJ00013]MCO0611748.1 phosphonate metabolism protein/1,5-bisphosphokinase (PRPP-forming) PhnN [Lutimaribacter sp. EGI FJ00015]MCO0635130.1 phosphonate metabolism protein/1,5-bisphosphokinase (PRPP-forming) PhnN [Lutimaribacter sp. EGI FJ00014]